MIPLETLSRYEAVQGARPAVVDQHQMLTWHEMEQRVGALANRLAAQLDADVQQRAVVFAGNTVGLVVATASISTLGIPWVGVDPERSVDVALEQIRSVQPTIVVVDRRLRHADAVMAAARDAVVLDIADGTGGCEAGPDQLTGWVKPPFMALGFTSGSTGPPKLFTRRTKSENQRTRYLATQFGFGPGDVYLVTSPLAYASGHVWANAALSLGATIVLGPQVPEEIPHWIARYRVTATFMVPPVVDRFLAAAMDQPEVDLTSLRGLLTGGRHVSTKTIRLVRQRLGAILHVYYATTETGINTFAGPGDLAAKPLTAGRPLAGVSIQIVDPDTRAAQPNGVHGLIAVSSDLNMDGYTDRPAELLVLDGRDYVLTSDFGYLDEDSALFIMGRSDSLPGAEPLAVVVIEDELKELDDAPDLCVVRTLDGDRIVVFAVVETTEPDSVVLDEIAKRLAELVPEQSHAVVAVSRIPYNTAGKIDARALAELLPASRGVSRPDPRRPVTTLR